MIISGGANIYPREIEEVLLPHPACSRWRWSAGRMPTGARRSIAFVVTRDGADVDGAALDALCLDNIARFKRPKDYRFVAALPKNNYGKVLKTELRQLLESGEALSDRQPVAEAAPAVRRRRTPSMCRRRS